MKKKKKKKLKEEVRLQKKSQLSDDGLAEEPQSDRTTSEDGKLGKQSAGMWAAWN